MTAGQRCLLMIVNIALFAIDLGVLAFCRINGITLHVDAIIAMSISILACLIGLFGHIAMLERSK